MHSKNIAYEFETLSPNDRSQCTYIRRSTQNIIKKIKNKPVLMCFLLFSVDFLANKEKKPSFSLLYFTEIFHTTLCWPFHFSPTLDTVCLVSCWVSGEGLTFWDWHGFTVIGFTCFLNVVLNLLGTWPLMHIKPKIRAIYKVETVSCIFHLYVWSSFLNFKPCGLCRFFTSCMIQHTVSPLW